MKTYVGIYEAISNIREGPPDHQTPSKKHFQIGRQLLWFHANDGSLKENEQLNCLLSHQ